MYKKILIGLLVILLGLSFTVQADAEEYTLKLGHHISANHFLNEIAKEFAERVYNNTDGKVKVEVYPGMALGDQKELIDGMVTGAVDISINDFGYLSNLVPELGIFNLPFLWKSYEHLENVYTGELGDKLKEKMKNKTGIRSLAFLNTDFRKFYLTEEVKSYKDLKGLPIRVPEAPVYVNTIDMIGAKPHTISWGDAITALNTGLVKGIEGEPCAMQTSGFAEITDYVLESNHIFCGVSLNMSEATFQELPKDIQEDILEAGKTIGIWGRIFGKRIEDEYYNKMKDKLQVVPVPEDDWKSLKEMVKPVHDKFIERTNTKEMYNKIVEIGKNS